MINPSVWAVIACGNTVPIPAFSANTRVPPFFSEVFLSSTPLCLQPIVKKTINSEMIEMLKLIVENI